MNDPSLKAKIDELAMTGLSDREIGIKLGTPTIEVARLRMEEVSAPQDSMEVIVASLVPSGKVKEPSQGNPPKKRMGRPPKAANFASMAKDERLDSIKGSFAADPKTKFILDGFSADSRELFISEFYRHLSDMESLTEAELTTLFTAILEYVLAMEAVKIGQIENKLYIDSTSGKIQKYVAGPEGQELNPKFRAAFNETFDERHDNHLKHYNSMLDSLKMTRKQRLDKITKSDQSLSDIALELSSKGAQAAAAADIEMLAKQSDAELKIMLTNGHIFGMFSDE